MKKWVLRIATGVPVLAVLVLAGMRWLVPTEVAVASPVRSEAVQAIYATGIVESAVTVRIAPQAGGRLVALNADEGDAVTAGQVLARLDDSDLRAALTELQARTRYAEQQYRRLEPLAAKGFVSADQLQQARANLDAARASEQRAGEQQHFMMLKSPVAGRIIRRDGEVGDFIPLNQPVFYLARDKAPLRIDADVDEEDIPRVQPGQEVLISADAFPERVFHGSVSDITPKGDPVARSYRVRIGLPADAPLMIGMTAETNIVVARHQNALLVPSSAVNRDTVWLVREGRAVLQAVKIGARGSERTEILSGVADSDRVIVQAPAGLQDGHRVRTRTDNAPAKATP